MIRFQNEYVVVKLEFKATAIFLSWKGFPPSLQYREGLEKSLEIAQKYGLRNWISDIRFLEGIGKEDQEWVGREWLPKAVSAGSYRYQAVIVSEYHYEEVVALDTVTSIQNQPIEIRHFASLKDAKKWLEELEE